jgi:hypothetical protein
MTPPRPLLPALLLLVAGCAAPGSGVLSYADVQALNPGASAEWILREFPSGRATRDAEGRLQELTYRVNDPAGRAQTLVLLVGPDGLVREKRYSGPVIRPRSGP